jgi:hypothetical protein
VLLALAKKDKNMNETEKMSNLFVAMRLSVASVEQEHEIAEFSGDAGRQFTAVSDNWDESVFLSDVWDVKPFMTDCCSVNNECICAGSEECTVVDDTSDVDVLAFGEVYDDFFDWFSEVIPPPLLLMLDCRYRSELLLTVITDWRDKSLLAADRGVSDDWLRFCARSVEKYTALA